MLLGVSEANWSAKVKLKPDTESTKGQLPSKSHIQNSHTQLSATARSLSIRRSTLQVSHDPVVDVVGADVVLSCIPERS